METSNNNSAEEKNKLIPEWKASADEQTMWVGLAVFAVLAFTFGWFFLKGGDEDQAAKTTTTVQENQENEAAPETSAPKAATKTETSNEEEPTPVAETALVGLASQITTEEDGDDITLRGFVANEDESAAAEKIATDSGKYEQVTNGLEVLEPEVLAVLEEAEVANAEAEGTGTEITVRGSVATEEEKQSVYESAQQVPGVTKVNNEIEVNAVDVINSLPQVQFRTGSSQILPESFSDLDRAAELLEQVEPSNTVEIQGYTDTDGDEAANLKLSTDRAEAVQQYLISKDVDPTLLSATGYGETTKFDEGSGPEALAANRKVVLVE